MLDGFVLGNTGVHKDNNAILLESRQATTRGIQMLEERIPGFDLRTTQLEQAEPHLAAMEPNVARRVRANMINRDICGQARQVLSSESPDHARLGELLYRHQEQLRDGIGVSHPKLDELIDVAMEAGALAAKLTGGGKGGHIVALVEEDKVSEVLLTLEEKHPQSNPFITKLEREDNNEG